MDNKASQTRVRKRGTASTLPSEPPHDDKEPKDEDEEDDVPQPSTPLTPSHIVHAPKRARENARRLRKSVVHLTELDRRVSHLIPNPNRDLLEHFYFGAKSLNGLVILAFDVVCEACACKGCGV